MPLTHRLLASGQLAGMTVVGTAPSVVSGAAAWAGNEQLSLAAASAEIAQLRRLGFVAGVLPSP